MLTLRSLRKARGAVPLVAGGLACGVLTVRNRTLAASLCSAATSNPTPEIVLYQYKTCPFCNKVKSYLDYNQVDYAVVEVNPLTKSEIKFSKGYNKVPIATVNGELITDSSLIIEKVSTFAKYAASVKSDDSEKWSEWADKKLAVYLYPNITRSMEESWECFSYADNVETWSLPMRIATRVAGTAAMSLANGKIKKKYGIVDERKELLELLTVWTDALGNKPFLHGDKITLPDLQVYGVLRAIEGLTTFKFIMQENATLKAWYDRVQAKVPSKDK